MNNRILIGVISYLPDDEIARQKRLDVHNKQLTWLKNNFLKDTKYDLKCIYQKYKDTDIPQILKPGEFDVYDSGLHIGPARNKVLDYFYEEDYDICVIFDDDVLLYDYYDCNNLLNDLLNSDCRNISLITTISARKQPFKEYNTNIKDKIEKYWVLETCSPQANCIFILHKNIKKSKVYFKDLDLFKFEGFEDIEFILNLIRSGFKPYVCKQLITKFLSDDVSTWASSYEERISVGFKNRETLCNMYSDCGIRKRYSQTGKFLGFTHPIYRCNSPEVELIKRDIPYITPEHLLYKKKDDKGKKRLF